LVVFFAFFAFEARRFFAIFLLPLFSWNCFSKRNCCSNQSCKHHYNQFDAKVISNQDISCSFFKNSVNKTTILIKIGENYRRFLRRRSHFVISRGKLRHFISTETALLNALTEEFAKCLHRSRFNLIFFVRKRDRESFFKIICRFFRFVSHQRQFLKKNSLPDLIHMIILPNKHSKFRSVRSAIVSFASCHE
jgi:hypothetical protein